MGTTSAAEDMLAHACRIKEHMKLDEGQKEELAAILLFADDAGCSHEVKETPKMILLHFKVRVAQTKFCLIISFKTFNAHHAPHHIIMNR